MLTALCGTWLKQLKRMFIQFTFCNSTVTYGNTKSFVFTSFPVLSLTGLATVVNQFANRTSHQQQFQAVAAADTTIGTLSLVACAWHAGNRATKRI